MPITHKKTFLVVIPPNSKYRNPDLINERVVPLLKNIEPHTRLKQEDSGQWKIETPLVKVELVRKILRGHFGFILKEMG